MTRNDPPLVVQINKTFKVLGASWKKILHNDAEMLELDEVRSLHFPEFCFLVVDNCYSCLGAALLRTRECPRRLQSRMLTPSQFMQASYAAVLAKLESFDEHINHTEGTDIKFHYKA